ncbi:MAG TPA: hypothetical protein VFL80_08735 [Thermoanaerobaculia bacterium]|nr:hypothetical protein [Thermoanaerobaculia bacterium]
MRRLVLFTVLLLLAANAFGHAGEVHKYLGTVETVHKDGSFMLKKTDGVTIHVEVAKTTRYQHADGSPADGTSLADGRRVVVTISKDGKTATLVRFGGKKE